MHCVLATAPEAAPKGWRTIDVTYRTRSASCVESLPLRQPLSLTVRATKTLMT